MESYVLKQETRGEDESKDSNEEDNDEEDEDDDDVDEEEEEMGDLDDENLLVEIEDNKSSELPSGTEDSEIDQQTFPLTNSTKSPPSEPDVIQKIQPSEDRFLAEIDVKQNIKQLTTSPKSRLSNEVNALTNHESNCKNLNSHNQSRAVKREISCVDHEVTSTTSKLPVKRRVPVQSYVDDDDVIVLSD